jgi:serine/threonine-protein phosphatase PPG1
MHSLDLDHCIEKLKRRELLREATLEAICEQVKEVLMRESNVVHVAAPITVVGDIHGCSPSFLILRLIGQTILRFTRDFPDRGLGSGDELLIFRRLCGSRIFQH